VVHRTCLQSFNNVPKELQVQCIPDFPQSCLVYDCDIMSLFMDFMNLNLYICSTC